MHEQDEPHRRPSKIALSFCLLAILGCDSRHTPTTQCDERTDARYAWIATATAEYGGFSPEQRGFKAIGGCGQKLLDRQLSCSESEVRSIVGDSPYLSRALGLGFTTYVCEVAKSGDRVEFSLASVVH